MPFFPFFLVYILIIVNVRTVRSIGAETDSVAPEDSAVSAGLSAVLIDSGLPDYQGDLFADSNLADQGSLLASSDANPAVVGSGSTASGGLGPLLATLDTSSIIPDMGFTAQETKEGLFADLNIVSDADTVAIIPEDQGRQLDNSIITSSTLETDVTAPKDQGQIVPSTSELEAAVPDCGIGQTEQEKQLSCPSMYNQDEGNPRRRKPDQNRPSEFVEPPQGRTDNKVEYGKPNPWIRGLDSTSKRCSNTK
ncbi:hypothetical protein MMC29_005269, partial [Sticta canariensis]|nr:hypothetical protein [Sticta canariensis]